MSLLPHLASRIFNVPLLIHPAKLDAILHGLGPRFGLPDHPEPEAYLTPSAKREPGGYRVVNGVAVIDIFGVLAHRTRIEADSSWIQGYNDIGRQLEASLNDSSAKAILLQIDSPGGEVAGAFQLAEQIRAARDRKPIHAVASDLAASAAYLIASAATTIAAPPTAMVGSIGVVMRHVDLSGALAKEGVTVTHIYAGARKIDGNPYQSLPDSVRGRFQAEVDHVYGLFVAAVAAHRKLDETAVRNTEAGLLRADEAHALGLIDSIENPDQLLARLAAGPARAPRASAHLLKPRTLSMTDQSEPTVETVLTQADVTAARDAGRQAGIAEGRAQERARIGAILDHPESAGREALARTLALTTDLTAEQAGPILAASPKAEPAAPAAATDFAAHMARIGNPAVGPDAKPVDESVESAAVWDRAFQRVNPAAPAH